MARVSTNPKQLVWARKLRNFSVPQAAGQIGITQKELLEYEKGLNKPTATVFQKIAKVYGIPEATLFLESPPSTEREHLRDFRTRTVAGIPPVLSSETIMAISRVRTYQQRLSELSDNGHFGANLSQITTRTDPYLAGEAERTRLGISLDQQLSWSDPDDAFRNWRKIIENQGVCVYVDKFPRDDCKGASFLDNPLFPAILLNKTEPKKVGWIYSLLHEYGHLLIGKPGISDASTNNEVEAYCNRFASGFLMPIDHLKHLIDPWPRATVEWAELEIVRIARRLKVSQQAVALRLETLGIAPKGFYESFKTKQAISKPPPPPGIVPPMRKRLFALGRRFPTVIIAAMDRGFITPVDATQILNANTTLLSKIRSELGV